MEITFSKKALPKRGSVIVLITEGDHDSDLVDELDTASDGLLRKAIKTESFKGQKGKILKVVPGASSNLERIILYGVGKVADLTPLKVEHLGGGIVANGLGKNVKSLTVLTPHIEHKDLGDADFAAHFGVGLYLRDYAFDRYKTKLKPEDKSKLTKVAIGTDAAAGARRKFAVQQSVADGVFLTRDLVSEPANVLFPEELANRASELSDLGVDVQVLGEKQMTKLGMGSLLGVGQGSARESKLVIMNWKGATKAKAKTLALVGKGVTFDTGGISLKPAGGMEQMKWDMGGAGAVVGAMHALAARKAKANVVGIVGLVENMPGANAQRPGDVVTSMSGQTIEVINTDAEGRLVLADALWYVQEKHKPDCIVDLATLTGAILVSLGHEFGGLFSNNDDLSGQLTQAGESVGDLLWRMPMGDAYDKMINSQIADMKNVGGRNGGSITAAQFLARFIQNDTPWAHLDIAGMAWSDKDLPTAPKGGTGFGVRLLDKLIADHFE